MPESDRERALAFRDYLEDECRYIRSWKQWVFWDGKRWQTDDMGVMITQRAMDFAEDLLDQANGYPPGAVKLAAVVQASKASARTVIDNMVALLKSLDGISARPMDFDCDPLLLGTQNGCVNLRDGSFREAKKEDMILKRTGCNFNPSATCPMWREFQLQILVDEELMGFVKRASGYSLTGKTNEQVLFFLYGTGQNGKSTFIGLMKKLLGDYAWKEKASLFIETRVDDVSANMFAGLPEKRMVIGAEMPDNARLSESRIKDLTGGDELNARKLFCESFNFTPTHKLWFYGNHRPMIHGTDEGIWRRMKMIPFTVHIDDDKRDFNIDDRLWIEAEGILNWAIEGCLEWQKGGLRAPAIVTEAVAEYRDEEDLIWQFIEAECQRSGEIPRGLLSGAFRDWAVAEGYKYTASPRAVADRVKKIPGVTTKMIRGIRKWVGLSLKDEKAYKS